MAWITEDRCVQCADGCRVCGRKEYRVQVCDECGGYLGDKYFVYRNTEYCPDCAYEFFLNELIAEGYDEAKDMDVDEMAYELEADICED